MVNARFQADFSSFNIAVQQAQAKLVDFSQGAYKTEGALNRMVDNFSGRKIIQEAALMERAIAQAGGVVTLTGNQLQQAGIKATEAVEKMKRLGLDIPPGLQLIANQTKNVTSGFAGMLGTAGKLAGVLGIGFGVGAVVSFGKAVLADADALTKMHDKTGVSVEGLQRLRIAGDDVGNTLEQMTTGINMMQRRLAGDDASLLKGFRDLGLSIEKIKGMAPDKQFMAIADAIRAVKDPAEQVNLAMEIFGRSGAELLPVIKRGFDDVTDSGSIMSAEAIKALDDAGDEIERLWRRTKAAIGETVGQAIALRGTFTPGMSTAQRAEGLGVSGEAAAFAALNAQVATLTKSVKAVEMVGSIPQILMPDKDADAIIRQMDREMDRLKGLRDAAASAGVAADRAFDEMIKRFDMLEVSVPKVTGKVLDFNVELGRLGLKKEIPQITDGFAELGPEIQATSLDAVAFGRNLQILPPAFKATTESIQEMIDADLAAELEAYSVKMSKIANVFGGASRVLDQVGGKFGELGRIAANTGEQIFSNLASGNVFGAVIAGITGVGAALKGAFRDEEAEKVNDMRDDFVTMSGGLHQLNVRAQQAGLTLDRLLKTSNVKAYTKEVERLKDAFDFQNSALEELADTEEKYHLSLDKASASLFREYQTLIAAGHGADDVLRAMQGSWQDLVDDALKFGTVVPESLKPMIQRLIELGQLTDADGNKLEDISQIKFGAVGDSFTDAFSRMNTGIERLVAVIKQSLHLALTDIEKDLLGIGNAIANLPDELPLHWRQERRGGASASNAILTPAAVGRLGAAASGGSPIVVNVNPQINALDGASVAQWLRERGARDIADAIAQELPRVLDTHGLRRIA